MRRGQARGEEVQPIARWVVDGDDRVLLLDPTATRIHFQVSERTVRRRCEPVACDVATRAPLYHELLTAEQLTGVRARPGATAAARRATAAAAYQMAS